MKTILWDMDGVLIDSLGLDLKVINPILEKEFGVKNGVSKDFLKSIFACAVPEFCKMILEKIEKYSEENLNKFIVQFEEFRRNAKFDLLPNVAESLEKFKKIKQFYVFEDSCVGIRSAVGAKMEAHCPPSLKLRRVNNVPVRVIG